MLKVIFTLDYEIYGNGDGSPKELMIKPTNRLLDIFDRYNAKLTIFVDVAEIIKFKEYYEQYGFDLYNYEEIVNQIQVLVKNGHDVQLHLHPSYFNAVYEKGKWMLDWDEYDLANLTYERISELINISKKHLEDIIKPVYPSYKCFAFRSANWSMHPSKNVVRALIDNDFVIDTSVFKFGKRSGLVNFDYSNAHSDLLPWRVSEENICVLDKNSKLIEFPIYSENNYLYKFISINRLYRVFQSKIHRLKNPVSVSGSTTWKNFKKLKNALLALSNKHAMKMDFNQCTTKQLINGLKSVNHKYSKFDMDLPFVLIGHSKLFNSLNEKSLVSFLRFIAENPDQYGFGTFSDFRYSKIFFKQPGKTNIIGVG